MFSNLVVKFMFLLMKSLASSGGKETREDSCEGFTPLSLNPSAPLSSFRPEET